MPTEKQPFVVMAKPVGSRCNMRCRYCYYLGKGKYSTSKKQVRMSFALLERLIREAIEASPGPVVSFIWHGGEPTLAGLDFYEKAVQFQHKYLPEGWQAWNNLQTNGLLINEAWCRFLKKNRFDVGVSIDGSEAVHDQNRHDLGGRPTWARTQAAIKLLKSHGIEPDLLCTVNSSSAADPLGVYYALRELDTGWVQFIPIVVRTEDGGFSPESVTPEGYGEFLCSVFDEWTRNDLGKLDVQLFAETARVWAGGEASLCSMAPVCGRAIIAEEDGGVYACDHFVDTAHRRGTLGSEELDGMVNGEEQAAFGLAKKDALTAECRRCPYLSCCNGNCPKDRFAKSEDGEDGQYYLCRGLKKFFAHADGPLHRIMALSREGKKPDEIMAIINNN